MPLPTFKTAEEIPESFRAEYVQVGEDWVPKAESDLATERRKRAELLNEKKEADRLRKEAEEKLAESERSAEARARGISEEALEEIRQKERAGRKPIEDERDRLAAENRQLKLTDRVKALALAAGVMPDRIKQAMKILDGRTDLGDKDGIVVKNEDGSVSSETIDDFLGTTFKAESPWFYAGTGSSGSGAAGSTADGAPLAPVKERISEAKRQQVGGAF